MGARIRFLDNFLLWLQSYFEIFVIAFAAGIAVYFALSFEPSLHQIIAAGATLTIAAFIGRKNDWSHTGLIWMLLIALFGLGRSAWHTSLADAPRLSSYERVYDVTGQITAIEKSGPRMRWVLRPERIGNLKADRLPDYIRVTTFDKTFSVGDGVTFRAELSAPPGPVIPGGYNPGFRAYYQQVGAYGFMMSRPQETSVTAGTVRDKASLAISKIRYGLAQRILDSAPEETAGLQVALLTGIRSWVTEDQTEALRAAGLAHILAISGLHMGLIAGSIYGLALAFLVRIDKLARRQDVRKIAAGIGIAAATFYLILSGASVATQRSYIMAVIVFSALIFDRQAISIRSVSVAAFITLWLHPEALVSPGFQMSFSAVLALVVVYRAWDDRRVHRPRGSIIRKFVENFKALTVTSFVAGGATGGFAVLHFNRIATYGLLGNIFAMPMFTFWVMPMALVVYVALIFGVEALPLWIMGKGIEAIMYVSNWVQALPGSVKYMASGPGWVMGVFGLAFIGLCLGNKRTKWISVAAMTLCWGTLLARTQPDIRIAENGALAFWSDEETPTLYVDRKNSDRYGRQEFIEAMGLGMVKVEGFDRDLARCDALGCRLEFKGNAVRIVRDPSEIMEDCDGADLVIVPKRILGARARRLCQTSVIDLSDLNKFGAHSLYLKADGTHEVKTARSDKSTRPWHLGY